MSSTVIDHDHRKSLGLSMEEYVVAQEIFTRQGTALWAFPAIVERKTGISESRVSFLINRLESKRFIFRESGGYVLSGVWYQTFSKFYRPLKDDKNGSSETELHTASE